MGWFCPQLMDCPVRKSRHPAAPRPRLSLLPQRQPRILPVPAAACDPFRAWEEGCGKKKGRIPGSRWGSTSRDKQVKKGLRFRNNNNSNNNPGFLMYNYLYAFLLFLKMTKSAATCKQHNQSQEKKIQKWQKQVLLGLSYSYRQHTSDKSPATYFMFSV